MDTWSGKKEENKAAPIKEEQEAAMPLGPLSPLKIYHDSHGPNGEEYPLCSECGRRHPVPGGPDSMGEYITLQHVKMGSIRAQEAAALARKEHGENPLVVKVFDAYIGAFIEPDQRDSFIEGLLLGLGSSQAQIEKLQAALTRIGGLLESMQALKQFAGLGKQEEQKEGKDVGRGF